MNSSSSTWRGTRQELQSPSRCLIQRTAENIIAMALYATILAIYAVIFIWMILRDIFHKDPTLQPKKEEEQEIAIDDIAKEMEAVQVEVAPSVLPGRGGAQYPDDGASSQASGAGTNSQDDDDVENYEPSDEAVAEMNKEQEQASSSLQKKDGVEELTESEEEQETTEDAQKAANTGASASTSVTYDDSNLTFIDGNDASNPLFNGGTRLTDGMTAAGLRKTVIDKTARDKEGRRIGIMIMNSMRG